jgi:hypothetical protein
MVNLLFIIFFNNILVVLIYILQHIKIKILYMKRKCNNLLIQKIIVLYYVLIN